MLPLNILGTVQEWGKKIIYWLSGLAVLTVLWRYLQAYLLKRTVRKSDEQAESDEKAHRSKVESAEDDWQKLGKESDKASRDSS